MSALMALPSPPQPWRQALAPLAVVVIALLVIYRDTFASMVAIWSRSDTFAHAFLVPPIALWLIWRRRDALCAHAPQPQPWLLLPVLAAAAMWLVGELAGANAVTHFCGVLAGVLAVPALLGIGVAREIAFPLAFLFFMVPTGEFVLPTLMQWTADVTVASLRGFGIPVYREGLTFVIPSGTWSVVEACSGVRYLIASFMVGTLFAYLQYRSTARRVAFSIVALLVPIVANWARAVIIVLLGHLTDNRLAAGVDHLIYGWIFFGVVIALMFIIGMRWSEAPLAAQASAPAPAAAALRNSMAGPQAWRLVVLFLLVLAAPHVVLRHRAAPPSMPPLQLPDLGLAPAPAAHPPAFAPTFERPRTTGSRAYADPAGPIAVHIAYYRHQSAGQKLISSENVLAGPQDPVWRRVAAGDRPLVVGGRPLSVRSVELRRGALGQSAPASTLHVHQVYWSDGRLTASEGAAALLAVRGEMLGRGDDAAAITISLAGSDPITSVAALDAFAERHLPALASWLDDVRKKH